jgi:ribosomal protein S18 acetylase RimI-like enzyme
MEAKGLRIENAVLPDAKRLSEIECECWGIEWSPYALWHWKLAIKFKLVLKATVEGQTVGGLVVFRTPDGKLCLNNVVITKAFRNLGIGSRLMESLVAGSSSPIILTTWETNDGAIRFYERFGFKRVGVVKDFYEEGLDYILMERMVPPGFVETSGLAERYPKEPIIKAYKTRSGRPCGYHRKIGTLGGEYHCLYNEGHLKQNIPHYFMLDEDSIDKFLEAGSGPTEALAARVGDYLIAKSVEVHDILMTADAINPDDENLQMICTKLGDLELKLYDSGKALKSGEITALKAKAGERAKS